MTRYPHTLTVVIPDEAHKRALGAALETGYDAYVHEELADGSGERTPVQAFVLDLAEQVNRL